MEDEDVLDIEEKDVLDHGEGCARPWRRRMC
jgi:hypothetical protein